VKRTETLVSEEYGRAASSSAVTTRMRIDQESLRTGVALIDVQHEAYLELVARLFESCQEDVASRDRLADELNQALAYAVEHFDAEEHLMRVSGYPYYEMHRARHDIFRDRADRFASELRFETSMDAYTIRLTEWLVQWFVEHIQGNDFRLASFLRSAHQSVAR
jgi:hemerythrin